MSTCKICTETFKKPVMMPCGHSFCQDCIVSWSEKNPVTNQGVEVRYEQDECGASIGTSISPDKVSCPTCREEHPMPEGGAAFFTRNYDLSAQPVCEWCDLNGADVKCRECNEWFCNPCKEKHHDIRKKTQSHVLYTVDQIAQGEMKMQYKLCQRHGKKVIELFCTVCNVPCCLTGGATIHKQHDCITLDDHHSQFCNHLLEQRNCMKGTLETFENLYDVWKACKTKQDKDKGTVLTEIKKRNGDLTRDATLKKNNTLQEIEVRIKAALEEEEVTIKEATEKKEAAVKEAENVMNKTIKEAQKKREEAVNQAKTAQGEAEEAEQKIIREAEIHTEKNIQSLHDYDEDLRKLTETATSQIAAEIEKIKKRMEDITKQVREVTPGQLPDKEEELMNLCSLNVDIKDMPIPKGESFTLTDKKNLQDICADMSDCLGHVVKIVLNPEKPELVTKIITKTKTDKCDCKLFDTAVISSDSFAVADVDNNRKAKVFHIDGKLMAESKTGQFSNPAWVIRSSKENDYLLVGNVSSARLNRWDFRTGQIYPLESVPGSHGISVTRHYDDTVLVVGTRNPNQLVLICPYTTSTINTFRIHDGYFTHIAGHENSDKVAVSYYNDKVCLYKQAQLVWKVDNDIVKDPRGLSMTSAGCVLVADSTPSRVIILSDTGQLLTTLLSAENGIKHPFGIHYDENHFLLAVAEYDTNELKVFRFSPLWLYSVMCKKLWDLGSVI